MRGAVSLRGLARRYGETQAVDGVSLEVSPGELLTLLGPSGSGKTTLLRLIAGFERPDAGSVLISGRDLTLAPPYRRPVNTVFQHYALFPHRDVGGNIAFGLEMARRTRTEIAERVGRMLHMVRLAHLAGRGVEQLSGGERQRVALARALVLEPEVLLLDEPLGALDLSLRKQMQVELKRLHEQVGGTFLFVTHDQEEAMLLSDRVAVMNRGRLEQVGAPRDLYERPRTRFVADFLAVRNVVEATVLDVASGRASLRTRGGAVLSAEDDGGYVRGRMVWIGIRPERIALEGLADNRLPGTLTEGLYLGDRTEWRVQVFGETLTVSEPAGRGNQKRRGESAVLSFPAAAVLRLDEGPPAERP